MGAASTGGGGVDLEKQQLVEKLLGDILTLMESPARLDFKDASDGSLAVAMHFVGEVPPGFAVGKKSFLVDSLQFLLNKCINRPNVERRWVTLGVGGFPEPRGARPAVAAAPPAVAAAVGVAATASRPVRVPAPTRSETKSGPLRNTRPPDVDESKLEVSVDLTLAALGKALAQKSAQLGRVYAVTMMAVEDRARLLQAAQKVSGVTARVEGEGHFRRLVFVPDKPTAMPKRHAMAVYPDDEEDGD